MHRQGQKRRYFELAGRKAGGASELARFEKFDCSPQDVDAHDIHHALVFEMLERHVPTGRAGVGEEKVEAAVLGECLLADGEDQSRVGGITRERGHLSGPGRNVED